MGKSIFNALTSTAPLWAVAGIVVLDIDRHISEAETEPYLMRVHRLLGQVTLDVAVHVHVVNICKQKLYEGKVYSTVHEKKCLLGEVCFCFLYKCRRMVGSAVNST